MDPSENKMTDTKTKESIRLMSLPGEIRNRIYEFTLLSKEIISMTSQSGNSAIPGLLRANKQIREECVPIYYRSNSFKFYELTVGPEHPMPAYFRYMRSISLLRKSSLTPSGQRQTIAQLLTDPVPNTIQLLFISDFISFRIILEELDEWGKRELEPTLDGMQLMKAAMQVDAYMANDFAGYDHLYRVTLSCKGSVEIRDNNDDNEDEDEEVVEVEEVI